MEYFVLAYYALVKLEDPKKEVEKHQLFFQSKDFRGRIYLSEEGINGQASATLAAAEEYIAWLRADPRFAKVVFKLSPTSEHAFEKMTVKYRKQLVALDQTVDFSQRGEAISSAQWKEMLEQKDEQTLLLDVRNDYEWKVGHFEGAQLPPLETFRQFRSYAQTLKKEKDPEQTVVMMYCTGGIRCEFFSAVLKEEGFEKVYQLEGGIIQYGLDDKQAEHWKGNLFVFDDRLVVPVGEEKKEPISHCIYCNEATDIYYNCANMDCNALFVCCLECARQHKGCCSSLCSEKPRVRPYQEGVPKPFRKWGKKT